MKSGGKASLGCCDARLKIHALPHVGNFGKAHRTSGRCRVQSISGDAILTADSAVVVVSAAMHQTWEPKSMSVDIRVDMEGRRAIATRLTD